MRRLPLILFLLFACAAAAGAWRIGSYGTIMQVQPDGSVDVTERIHVDFTGDPHHGIYRDIPFTKKDKFGNNYKIQFKVISVTDETGAPQETSESRSNGNLHIRIGDPNTYVSGPKGYNIRYKLFRAIHYFSDYDELYWNPVGPEWEVPVEKASCIVIVPQGKANTKLQTTSFSGMFGNTTSNIQSDTPNNYTARFWTNRPVNPGEYMTIVVGWPKGLVRQPSAAQRFGWFVTDNGYFFIPPIFILGVLWMWTVYGRDPSTGKSIMVSYDPPDNLRPAELGTLIDESADMRDISASIIDLAVRGYIHITADVKQGFLSSKKDYLFELLRPYDEVENDPALQPFERELVRAIFNHGQSRWMSSLENHFYVFLPKLKDHLYDSMVVRGYFSHRPDAIRTDFLWAGFMIVGLGGLAIYLMKTASIGWGVAIMVCGVILAAVSKAMPRKTARGKNALVAVRGFEEFLSRAEKEDIIQQEKQNLFEKFLPYAMSLGIASKWAKAFEGMQISQPDWYTGGTGFHPALFAHDLSSASSSWGQSMASTPRSSGDGSGFGGGGSSGGGGGGGGGGAW